MTHVRARGATGVVLAGLLAGLALAACGSPARPTSPRAAVMDAFARTVSVGSAQVDALVVAVEGGRTFRIRTTGVVDLHDGTAELTSSLPDIGTVDVRLLPGALYEKLPARIAAQVPDGKSWLGLSLAHLSAVLAKSPSLAALVSAATSDNPGAELSLLAKGGVISARSVGSAALGGVATTEYVVVLDATRLTQHLSATERSDLQALINGKSLSLRVWVDDSGRVRQVSFAERISAAVSGGAAGSTSVTLDYSHFGPAVHISPPPADQTFNFDTLLG